MQHGKVLAIKNICIITVRLFGIIIGGMRIISPILGHLVTVLIEIYLQATILTKLHLQDALGGEMDTIHHQIATFLTADTTTSDSIQWSFDPTTHSPPTVIPSSVKFCTCSFGEHRLPPVDAKEWQYTLSAMPGVVLNPWE